MGLYYSDDGRFCTSTLYYPLETFLTEKGIDDTKAAIIIQRWWRKKRAMRLNEIKRD
jgi:hypothetical protein